MSNAPFFSVVIPTCNRPDLLSVCLNSLAPGKQTLDISNYEVIVTDDSERQDSKILLSKNYPWIKYTSGPGKGPAANRNNGSSYSKGDWLIFIDDDCIPDATFMKAYQDVIIANSDVKVFEGGIYCTIPRKSLDEVSPVNLNGGYLWSCNFAIKRDLFNSIGRFDERYPYPAMEDVDLRTRLTKKGYKFQFSRNASVEHPWRKKGGWKSLSQHGKSTLIFLSIHPEEKKVINSAYYLKLTLRNFIYYTLPGVFKYKLKGLRIALVTHIHDLKMAFILLK